METGKSAAASTHAPTGFVSKDRMESVPPGYFSQQYKGIGAGLLCSSQSIVGSGEGGWGEVSNSFLQGTAPETRTSLTGYTPFSSSLHRVAGQPYHMVGGAGGYKPKREWSLNAGPLPSTSVGGRRPPAPSPDGMEQPLSPVSPGHLCVAENEGRLEGGSEGIEGEASQPPPSEKNETPAAAAEFWVEETPPPRQLGPPLPKLGVPAGWARLALGTARLDGNTLPVNLTKPKTPAMAPPDWSLRVVMAELDSELLSGPRLWMHGPGEASDHDREAMRLFQLTKKGSVLTGQELESLKVLYGLVVSQAVSRFCWSEIGAMVVALWPDRYKEVQVTPTPLDCGECRLTHSLVRHPGTGQIGACVPRLYNSPRVLSLMEDDWVGNAKGILIGLKHLQVQPPHLYGQLVNLSSCSKDDFSVSPGLNADSDDREVQDQPLFRFVADRLKKVEGSPHLTVYVEYAPPVPKGTSPDEIPISWGFLRTIQLLQKTTFSPIIVLLAPPLPEAGGTEESFRETKRKWLEVARRLCLMARALGVAFSPILVYSIPEGENTLVRSEYREEFLMNSRRELGREYSRRLTCWVVRLHRAVAAVSLPRRIFLAVPLSKE